MQYKLNEKASLGIGATVKRERFIISENKVTAELNDTLSFISLKYKATPVFTALMHLGYYTNSQLEFSDSLGKFDRANHFAGAIQLSYHF
ncbi:hypothetical protein L2734_10415 [Parashewanella spongiae]|uniref:hypothetical protein n=1 Tax=Parashewanella spongiae TaxID=342950 RepID=UPI0014051426|nr:hypothetical protein [Parashewanella spongiae]MCL1078569.1 hypothetical protein [Parashewanella spongiae]